MFQVQGANFKGLQDEDFGTSGELTHARIDLPEGSFVRILVDDAERLLDTVSLDSFAAAVTYAKSENSDLDAVFQAVGGQDDAVTYGNLHKLFDHIVEERSAQLGLSADVADDSAEMAENYVAPVGSDQSVPKGFGRPLGATGAVYKPNMD